MQDATDRQIEQYRKASGMPDIQATDEEWDAWLQRDDGFEGPPGAPLIILSSELDISEEDAKQLIEIEEAREQVLDGAWNEVEGRVKIVRGLLRLKRGDLWKNDPLVQHYDNPRWKEDYLAELIEWLKERNPKLQAGLSTLYNYMRYHQRWVEGYGFDEELVFGATENTRRALDKLAQWGYDGGMPTALRNGYDLEKLPQPASFTGEETDEEKLVAGIRQVAQRAFEQGRYSPTLFKELEKGDGKERIELSWQVKLDKRGVICGLVVFVEKTGADGEVKASFVTNLLQQEMPGEAFDWLESKGWAIEMEEC